MVFAIISMALLMSSVDQTIVATVLVPCQNVPLSSGVQGVSAGVLGDVGSGFLVWADVAAIEGPAGCLGQAKRHLHEVDRFVGCVVGVGEVGEVVYGGELSRPGVSKVM